MILPSTIQKQARSIFQEVVALRRDFHRYPELSYKEYRTSKIVSQYLTDLGLKVEHISGTGVTAVLKGEKQSQELKKIAFRADMDALPMNEETSHDFCSTVPNVMHACGHDAHTAMIMGAAKVLVSCKKDFSGEILFIFQPAEEKLPGGALAMLEEGVFNTKPDAVFGQHCIPQVPVGKIGFYIGPMMAAADEIYITVKGNGGHGSAPHKAKDPIVASAQIISSLQTIISRSFSPEAPGVVSITAIHGGTATNIIPNEVKLMGTLRTMDEKVRKMAQDQIKDITHFTAKALGVTADIEIRKGYPVLINSEEETLFAKRAAIEYLGEENVVVPEPIMGAEDFAYFLQETPGSFWQLGVGNVSKGITHNIHSSFFDIDENALCVGSGFSAYMAIKYLNQIEKSYD